MVGTVIDVLRERGFLDVESGAAMTSPELERLASDPQKPLRVYAGFDPSADSLHVGSMVPMMALAWFQRMGHTPIALVGGATGMIGDPSGRASERQLLDEATLRKNQEGIQRDLEQLLGRHVPICNNYDWYREMNVLAFLRDVGRHFRLGTMLAKDSVRARFESEEGMSFTEFSYQLLQGYDFWHLFQHQGVTLQIGGSDQWGNITAGIDLVRKVAASEVYGLTVPLLVRSDGQKFGKSEKGAIWLSREKLSSYEFYQYLFRIPDADVIRLLKLLTFVELREIESLERDMERSDYLPNTAQKRLAEEVTRLIHGEDGLQKALKATETVLPGKMSDLRADMLIEMQSDVPSCDMALSDIDGHEIVDAVVRAGFLPSKGEARRLIRNRGLRVNNLLIEKEDQKLSSDDLIDGRFLLFSFGKRAKAIIQVG